MSALDNVHCDFGNNYKWLSPTNIMGNGHCILPPMSDIPFSGQHNNSCVPKLSVRTLECVFEV